MPIVVEVFGDTKNLLRLKKGAKSPLSNHKLEKNRCLEMNTKYVKPNQGVDFAIDRIQRETGPESMTAGKNGEK